MIKTLRDFFIELLRADYLLFEKSKNILVVVKLSKI